MTILLFGKQGQLGRELKNKLRPLGRLIALDKNSSDYCGDFSNLEGLAETIRNVTPDFVVNASAYTRVDDAEINPKLASLINTRATEIIARETKKCGGKLIHFSTDYVFDGSGSHFRDENALTAPLNVYGRTKLLGDRAVEDTQFESVILRTSWVYSKHEGNFFKTILNLAMNQSSLRVVDDQIGAPTSTTLIADITYKCLRRLKVGSSSVKGIYNLASTGETSRYDYVKYILKTAREFGLPVTVADANVYAISSAANNAEAQRPLNSRLDTTKLCSALSVKLPTWQSGVREIVAIMARQNNIAS